MRRIPLVGLRNTMKEDLRRLIEIQHIDEEVEAERADQEAFRQELERSRQTVEETGVKQKESHDALVEFKKTVDRKNLDIKEQESHIEKDRTALNTSSSNKEYKVLLTDIEKRKADLSVVEDELLESMTGVDELEEKVKAAESVLKEQEKAMVEKKAEVEREVSISGESIRGLEQKRAAVAEGADPEVMSMYEKLSGRSPAVVPSEGGMCSGCNIALTAETISRLMKDDEIIRCLSCGRILYLDDGKEEGL